MTEKSYCYKSLLRARFYLPQLLLGLFFSFSASGQYRVREIFKLNPLSDEKVLLGESFWTKQSFVSLENIIGENSSITFCKNDTINGCNSKLRGSSSSRKIGPVSDALSDV